MTFRSVLFFLSVQLISLNFAHKLALRGAIEYSLLVNVILIGAPSLWGLKYLPSIFKAPLEKKQLFHLLLAAFVGISIAFVVDYSVWLLSLEPSLRPFEWKNGLFVAALYFLCSTATFVILFFLGYLMINKHI